MVEITRENTDNQKIELDINMSGESTSLEDWIILLAIILVIFIIINVLYWRKPIIKALTEGLRILSGSPKEDAKSEIENNSTDVKKTQTNNNADNFSFENIVATPPSNSI